MFKYLLLYLKNCRLNVFSINLETNKVLTDTEYVILTRLKLNFKRYNENAITMFAHTTLEFGLNAIKQRFKKSLVIYFSVLHHFRITVSRMHILL
jgi:predicted metal-binding protein